MRKALRRAFGPLRGVDAEEVHDAIAEAEHAIARVMSEGRPVALAPRSPELRKAQHRVVARYHLEAESNGREPMRHLVVFPSSPADLVAS
jgi:predicted RNA-binding protein Jag